MINYRVFFLVFYLSVFITHAQNSLPRLTLDTLLVSEDFKVADDYFKSKKMVFFGENHTFEGSNQLIKLKSVIFLYEKGYRYVAIELGAGIAYLANEYISTGDKKSFDLLNQGRPAKQKNSLHYLLHGLREFNKNKPVNQQVKIVGVDYTRYPIYSLKAMAKIIEDKKCEEEFSRFYEDLNVVSSADLSKDGIGFVNLREPAREDFDLRYGFKSYRNRLFELSVRNIVSDFYRDSTVFRDRLGSYYPSFSKIVRELDATVRWYEGEGINIQMHVERERHIAQNIKEILDRDSTAKITGQFGRCHVKFEGYADDCYSFSMNSMVQRLKEDSTLKEKILVVPIFYTQNTEITANQAVTDAKLSELIPGQGVYIYRTNSNLLSIEGVDKKTGIALINSYWSFASADDIIAKNEEFTRPKISKRKINEQNHFTIGAAYAMFTNNINEDLGTDLLPEENYFYGIGFESVDPEGWQGKMALYFIQPVSKDLDTVKYKYTNWFISWSGGYNFIYRKHFDLFSNYLMDFGVAKITEDRGLKPSDFTYDHDKQISKYRNPYFNLKLELGSRLKIGPVGIFAKGGYQWDVTNPKWRSEGILPQSRGLKFTNWYVNGGVSIIF
ncbi:MAG: erythromycin esterase family protein [Brumimicrobium sp.]|nr:erythromycin esterase family protein [Brumimicrobium sp.]